MKARKRVRVKPENTSRRLRSLLRLRPEDSASPRARLVHIVVLSYLGVGAIGGVVLARLPFLSAQRAAGLVLLSVFAVYLLERIFSLLWQWPLTHGAIKTGTLVRHPAVLWLVSFFVFGAATLEPAPLYLMQDPNLPFLVRGLVAMGVMINTLPFWLTTCFLWAIFRESRIMKGDPQNKIKRGWHKFKNLFRSTGSVPLAGEMPGELKRNKAEKSSENLAKGLTI